ncbi:MAG TPA: helix-turn-helix domain-containing protein [Afipia sp.]
MRAFAAQRKLDSRTRLLAAARDKFFERSYLAVSVEEITEAAQVSRITFYRHFAGKAEIVTAIFDAEIRMATPTFLGIAARDFRDPAEVKAWITAIFAADRVNRALLKVFMQATVDAPQFVERGHRMIADCIAALGLSTPAFALDPQADRLRWMEAWLLIYEIFDQSCHAALESGIASDPLMIELLAARFLRFVGAEGGTPRP